MTDILSIGFIFIITAAILTTAAASPLALPLERAFPSNNGIDLDQLRARDTTRHGRILKSSKDVVYFDVYGTSQLPLVGLYYTNISLGTPPVEFHVQIDTGSEVTWVSCSSCNGCPQTSGLEIELKFFEPKHSSTSSSIPCSDQRCNTGTCQNNQCYYNLKYGIDGGPSLATSGYYMSDRLHLYTISEGPVTKISSAPIVFGCSNYRSGYLSKSEKALDGIIGFGHQDISVISQLSAQGVTPRVFSHCLSGDIGGGTLVMGEIVEADIVYTSLDLSQSHYNLNLESISVNGWALQIDASVFATSKDRGTIVDSGTTLAYLAEEAYDPFVDAITTAIPQSVHTVSFKGYQCFLTTDSVTDIFPKVSLNFAGGVSLDLRPQDYLIQQNPINNGVEVWCIGFLKIKGQGTTILGDLVLKDKIFVYDLDGQRIGWADFNCSSPVNVSTTIGTGRHFNTGKISRTSCLKDGIITSFFVTLIFWFMFL